METGKISKQNIQDVYNIIGTILENIGLYGIPEETSNKFEQLKKELGSILITQSDLKTRDIPPKDMRLGKVAQEKLDEIIRLFPTLFPIIK